MSEAMGNGQPPTSPRRMPSILLVGVVFLVIGVLDVWRGVAPMLGGATHLATDDMLVLAIGIAALVGGGFVLRGENWARWLLAVWMALHVAISVAEPRELIPHLVIFGLLTYLLFRPRARAYFNV